MGKDRGFLENKPLTVDLIYIKKIVLKIKKSPKLFNK